MLPRQHINSPVQISGCHNPLLVATFHPGPSFRFPVIGGSMWRRCSTYPEPPPPPAPSCEQPAQANKDFAWTRSRSGQNRKGLGSNGRARAWKKICRAPFKGQARPRWISLFRLFPSHATSPSPAAAAAPALLYSRPDSSPAAKETPGIRSSTGLGIPLLLLPCQVDQDTLAHRIFNPKTPFCQPSPWKVGPCDLKSFGWPAGQLSVGSMGAGVGGSRTGSGQAHPSAPGEHPLQVQDRKTL